MDIRVDVVLVRFVLSVIVFDGWVMVLVLMMWVRFVFCRWV